MGDGLLRPRDCRLRAAAFVGSNFTNGTIDPSGGCISGVDNGGFVMGTSSSLFNQAFLQIDKTSGMPDFLLSALNQTLAEIGQENRDVASWPNPFYQYLPGENANANSSILTLVDGGENLQNIPLHPLTLSDRHVDVIFAIDGSADTTTLWPNGTALVATYSRSSSGQSTNNSAFPRVPDQNTFVNLGLNKRPTFFGCGDTGSASEPLIVYLPNAPYTYHSSVSTFDLEYSVAERNQIIQNGYKVATMGNGTADPDWPACVAAPCWPEPGAHGDGRARQVRGLLCAVLLERHGQLDDAAYVRAGADNYERRRAPGALGRRPGDRHLPAGVSFVSSRGGLSENGANLLLKYSSHCWLL